MVLNVSGITQLMTKSLIINRSAYGNRTCLTAGFKQVGLRFCFVRPTRYAVGRMSEVTRILQSMEQGDPKAAEELLPLVYAELRKLAAARMAQEVPGQTLQPTALVHEAWLRLAGSERQEWRGRAHFFGAAAEAMRRILIDQARRKASQKRGSGQPGE